MTTWTIVVAGGSGARFGRPKQFEFLGDEQVVTRAVRIAALCSAGVVLVLPPGALERPETAAQRVVDGGASRSASVRAGLAAVPADATVVVVHDAARPLASAALFSAVVEAVDQGADAAIPAVPVRDTIRRLGGGTVDRSTLVAVQTPQAFRAAALREAHSGGGEATDDATLVEQAGGRVVVVAGDPQNLKITDPHDLAVARLLADQRDVAAATSQDLEGGSVSSIRIGHGYDVHRRSEDPARPLILGGERFEGEPGLVGHSDADAIAHACTDALLAAAGLGDIGQLYPDTDPAFAGVDSVALLTDAVARVREAGWEPGNVDCTVVAESPKLAPRKGAIEARLTAVVGAPVTVKGKRAEGLGALGRREGIAAFAVALVQRRTDGR